MNVFQRRGNTLQFIENYHNDLAHMEECRENREKYNGWEECQGGLKLGRQAGEARIIEGTFGGMKLAKSFIWLINNI